MKTLSKMKIKMAAKTAALGAMVALFTPALIHAQVQAQNIRSLLQTVEFLLNRVVVIVIIIAVIWFVWGLMGYIADGSGDPKGRAEGRERMIWGTIAFFVMISVWGLVSFLQSALGIRDEQLTEDRIPFVGGETRTR